MRSTNGLDGFLLLSPGCKSHAHPHGKVKEMGLWAMVRPVVDTGMIERAGCDGSELRSRDVAGVRRAPCILMMMTMMMMMMVSLVPLVALPGQRIPVLLRLLIELLESPLDD
jgi:hypothetical protein